MRVSAQAWHGEAMTTSGSAGTREGICAPSHDLIVIRASSRLPLSGHVHRAPLPAVTPPVNARGTRLVGSAPRARSAYAGEAA
jgi:hypothetical protein